MIEFTYFDGFSDKQGSVDIEQISSIVYKNGYVRLATKEIERGESVVYYISNASYEDFMAKFESEKKTNLVK